MISLEENILNIKGLYNSRGYKLTPQRRVVVIELLKSKKRHLSCGEIYNVVKRKRPSIGLSTVYRAVATLEEIGILKKAFIDNNSIKYEICSNYEKANHFHLICTKCGSVIEVKDEELDIFIKTIYNNFSFEIKERRVNFFGICNDCKKN